MGSYRTPSRQVATRKTSFHTLFGKELLMSFHEGQVESRYGVEMKWRKSHFGRPQKQPKEKIRAFKLGMPNFHKPKVSYATSSLITKHCSCHGAGCESVS